MMQVLESLQSKLSLIASIDNENNQVISREKEFKYIMNFINQNIESDEEGEGEKQLIKKSLYICGSPGTGKSLTVNSVLIDVPNKTCKVIYINCMNYSYNIYPEIYRKLKNLKSTKVNEKQAIDGIETTIVGYERKILLVLDEVDFLVTKHSDILYHIFEWPYIEHSQMFIVGVANGLNLIEKFLTKLTKIGREPQLLNFKPYTEEQIARVLRDRVNSCRTMKYRHLFSDDSLNACARQVSNNNGDMRKALEILKRVVSNRIEEILELGEDEEDDEDDSPFCEDDEDEEMDVEIEESSYLFPVDSVLDVIDQFYDNDLSKKMKELPLHAQLVLLGICQFPKGQLDFGNLYDSFLNILKSLKFGSVSKQEFSNSLGCISNDGLIKLVDHKEESKRKITRLFSKQQVKYALGHMRLVKNLIEDINDDEEES